MRISENEWKTSFTASNFIYTTVSIQYSDLISGLIFEKKSIIFNATFKINMQSSSF